MDNKCVEYGHNYSLGKGCILLRDKTGEPTFCTEHPYDYFNLIIASENECYKPYTSNGQ